MGGTLAASALARARESGAPLTRSRRQLAERLEARGAEIEQAMLARVNGVAEPSEQADLQYLQGLRLAVSVGLRYGIEAIGKDERHAPKIPTELLAQARMAARNSVGVDTVLRRYFGGYQLLGDFLMEEADKSGLKPAAMKRLLRDLGASFDRLIEAVSEEHEREAHLCGRPSPRRRRAAKVERLLRGEALDASELSYDLEGWHLGLVLCAEQSEALLTELARCLDRRLLAVRPQEEEVTWAWLGGQRRLGSEALLAAAHETIGPDARLALGEAAQGIAGWRATLQQAKAVLPLAAQSPGPVRYSELGLLACVMKDDVLVDSLHHLYIAPLTAGGDGETLLGTLRAYFGCARSLTSAAAVLGISRQAVARRLRTVEKRLGRTVEDAPAELEIALRLDSALAPVGKGTM